MNHPILGRYQIKMSQIPNQPMPFQFWYEFASTYSYLTVMRIEEVTRRAGILVEWKPFLLGPIFKKQGWNDSPFNLYPAKGRYMWRDLERRTERQGVVFKKASVFPRSGLLAARVAICGMKQGWGVDFTKKVFEANFKDDQNIADALIIKKLLNSLNVDAESILIQSSGDDVKEALRRQTEEAMELGIFGAPSFVVGRELFWGDDRLEEAVEWFCAHKV